MGALAAGDVVVVKFPFSDLTQSKFRPAVCLAPSGRGDWVLCQITSKTYGDPVAETVAPADFAIGALPLLSFARPAKLFTAHISLIANTAGTLQKASFERIIDAVIKIFRP